MDIHVSHPTHNQLIGCILLAFLLQIGISSLCLAQNGGTSQVEYTSFEPAGGKEMVNPFTGDFSYSMPLVHVPGPGGGYPISLFYHGGRQVDEVGSWVGLGWNMNAGAISRSVVGNPDDWKGKKRYLMTYDYFDEVETSKLQITSPLPKVPVGLSFDWGSH